VSHLPPRHQFGYAGLVFAALLGFGFFGAQRLREPAPMTFQSTPPTSNESPPAIELGEPKVVVPIHIVVHVAGAVKKPGVIRAKPSMRVEDAIRLAGGATDAADLEALNLAAKLEDGTQLFVPRRQAAAPQPVAEVYAGGASAAAPYSVKKVPSTASPPATTRTAKTTPGVVSLNTGSQSQLETLPGVGPATAAKILEYRQAHGGFGAIEEIMAVKGIGPKKYEAMKRYLKL
jgi:competence protein ComEA